MTGWPCLCFARARFSQHNKQHGRTNHVMSDEEHTIFFLTTSSSARLIELLINAFILQFICLLAVSVATIDEQEGRSE
jgi:hypothetical protein